MLAFIKRNGSKVLWSFGNYRYEIEDQSTGEKIKFESSCEEAIARLDEVSVVPSYYAQDGGSMCNGIGRSYF